ncbi:DUF1365 domain-containing protein [Alisedimentitalea sp. MJ-SS2]|uniref:DUF1365 domain-containing protein n=1 Tax=Aliisedimentitalea sp. MJ-SS2 TaxID=3049795 RepID=UPI0029101B83|nr:DUF1365 domain-containing protein [Alisedimentitalea sp. MJ-SS2]MDU8927016.1 DUF1365 domain-containing protein [Alisedimentitalea sp. MJ-SS2]
MLEHIQAQTLHARRGTLKNTFSYGVDFVLTDLGTKTPALMSRNRFNLWSLWDRHHGGARGDGRGLAWFKQVLHKRGFQTKNAQLLLLTQPSFLWFHFNPVSFWIALVDGTPRAFVAEVNSTFGQRHCYFCAHEDFRPIERGDALIAEKLMHVSPFQKIAGHYRFNFGFSDTRIDIRISFENEDQGVLATLAGDRCVATNKSLLWAAVRRPLGAVRVLALIHWQAAILYLKRAPFLRKQPAPATFTSESQPLSGPGK